MAATKYFFRGTFCWYGEDHVLYRWAYSKNQAFVQMVAELAKKLGKADGFAILHYFRGTNRYKLEQLKKKEG